MTAINHHLTATEFSNVVHPTTGVSLIDTILERRALAYYSAIEGTDDMKGKSLYSNDGVGSYSSDGLTQARNTMDLNVMPENIASAKNILYLPLNIFQQLSRGDNNALLHSIGGVFKKDGKNTRPTDYTTQTGLTVEADLVIQPIISDKRITMIKSPYSKDNGELEALNIGVKSALDGIVGKNPMIYECVRSDSNITVNAGVVTLEGYNTYPHRTNPSGEFQKTLKDHIPLTMEQLYNLAYRDSQSQQIRHSTVKIVTGFLPKDNFNYIILE